jgi:hypothetical protein
MSTGACARGAPFITAGAAAALVDRLTNDEGLHFPVATPRAQRNAAACAGM